MKLPQSMRLQLGRLKPMHRSAYSAGYMIVTTVQTSDTLAGKQQIAASPASASVPWLLSGSARTDVMIANYYDCAQSCILTHT